MSFLNELSDLHPYATWLRNRTAHGHGKWHLLTDVRQLRTGAAYSNQTNSNVLSPDRAFASSPCGQALSDPDFTQPDRLESERWALVAEAVWIPAKGAVCTVCVEALIRHENSNSLLKGGR